MPKPIFPQDQIAALGSEILEHLEENDHATMFDLFSNTSATSIEQINQAVEYLKVQGKIIVSSNKIVKLNA